MEEPWWQERYADLIEELARETAALGDEEVISFDPIEACERRLKYATTFLRVLVAGRDSENEDLRSKLARGLRSRYLFLVHAYAGHDARWDRGWAVPSWPTLEDVEVGTPHRRMVAEFSWDKWLLTAVPELRHTAALHFAAIEAVYSTDSTRPVRKRYNTTLALVTQELKGVLWATEAAALPRG